MWFFHHYPQFEIINNFMYWPIRIFNFNPDFPLVLFFLLFTLVIRNRRVPHFVRYHTMLALMFDIFALVTEMVKETLVPSFLTMSSWIEWGNTIAFISCSLPCAYGMLMAFRGFYVDLPFFSDASYVQTTLSEMD